MATNNDIGGHNVESYSLFKFNSDGKLVKAVGGKGGRTGQFDYPCGIALSKNNKLFVCDKLQSQDTSVWH